MRILVIAFLLFIYNISFSQEKLLNQCFVFELDSDVKTDLRSATFDLPFAAMRASKDNKKKIVPHYAFDIQSMSTDKREGSKGITVVSMRAYEYGETLADNEIAFFVMPWPESHRPQGMGEMLASFPSTNGMEVTTEHLILNESFELSEKLVSQLELPSNKIGPGSYRLGRMEVGY